MAGILTAFFPSRGIRGLLAAGLSCLCLSFAAAAANAEEISPTRGIAAPPEYRIAAEDVLEVFVWREPDLTREVIVRPDGGISLPLVGDMPAAGLTPAELEASIRLKLAEYIPEAVVTASIRELKGLRIYVTGQVQRPGHYEVGRYIDVLQAITLAGGFTPFADVRNVQIIRRDRNGEQVFQFNYNQVQRGRNMSQNIMLKTDDVVLVP
jgi:polysaccharide biosynthesis/export protein